MDVSAPVRFLIAETESGYTLLTALWLARLFGVERHVEISPLFETAEALEDGARVIAEALRSPHWCSLPAGDTGGCACNSAIPIAGGMWASLPRPTRSSGCG